jgi:hypothetical protein
MKAHLLLIATAAFTLAGCSKTPDGGPATAPAKPDEVASAKPEVAPVGAISISYVIGKWAAAADGDCTLWQDFKSDGSVEGMFDSWKLNGSVLT